MEKRVLDARRCRRMPPSFGWVDHRLVRQGHIRCCSPTAWGLYLFLVTVADAQGLSYYSEEKAASLLSMDAAAFAQARRELLQADLVAWDGRLYQVLDLDEDRARQGDRPVGAQGARRACTGEARSLGSILADLVKEASHGPEL